MTARKSGAGLYFGAAVVAALGVVFAIEVALLAVRAAGGAEGGAAGGAAGGLGLPLLGGEAVAVVRIEGTILDGREILTELDRYAEKDWVRAIVLSIESGGGAVAACQEIADRVRAIRAGEEDRPGKPVVAYLGNVGASGAYYIASAADGIVSESGSLVGSIGVIYVTPNLEGLLEKLGVEVESVASGDLKEAGAWYRPLRPEERAQIRSVIEDAYEQFVADVLAGRAEAIRAATGEDDAAAALAKIADGRILTGRAAIAHGLVDRTGTRRDAIEWAAELAGIEGKPRVVGPSRRRFSSFESLFGAAFSWADVAEVVHPPAGLYYLHR